MTQLTTLGRQRGASMSVLVCLLVPTLLLCIGLAVDGAAKAAADRQAEAVAAQAARTGVDAAAPALLTGGNAQAAALAAADRVIAAHPEVTGRVELDSGNSLVVTTTISTPTIFLGLAGIHELSGHGQARVDLRPG